MTVVNAYWCQSVICYDRFLKYEDYSLAKTKNIQQVRLSLCHKKTWSTLNRLLTENYNY